MQLKVEPYLEQVSRWPNSGKVIMAQYDEQSVIVYQAYNESIGRFAAEHGYFGGPFSYSRMTWIKPNFLWMMYRSGWGGKDGQEVTLAVKLQRSAFNQILRQAVHSTFDPSAHKTLETWQLDLRNSDVRLQWDPDHDAVGGKLERRAIQLGLRGEAISRYGKEWILEIEDISDFVREQREHIGPAHHNRLLTPYETIYPVDDAVLASRLGLQ